MKMIPAFKDYLWGGEKLVYEYAKQTSLRPVAESWEVSCHKDGPGVVANGSFAGRTLADVLAENPSFAGSLFADRDFPILIKYIDAKQKLSVQVHPSDDYALQHENQLGKNECWYVVDASQDATLILGCKNEMSRQQLHRHIADNTLTEHLHAVPVRPGDFFEVPAGMLHAIGAGCLIAEVQQSSNVTYRVHDYGRVDADGKLRELHIDRALDTTDTTLKAEPRLPGRVQNDGYACTELTDWPFFSLDLLEITAKAELKSTDAQFQCIMVLDGSVSIVHSDMEIGVRPGESLFIPACIGNYVLRGAGKVLRVIPK